MIPVKWHWRRKCKFPAWDSNPRHPGPLLNQLSLSGIWSWALSQPYFTTLLIFNKKNLVLRYWDWRVFYCNMRFHWKKIGLDCLMHNHENEILLSKYPTVCMRCNGIKYCGCRRCFFCWDGVVSAKTCHLN